LEPQQGNGQIQDTSIDDDVVIRGAGEARQCRQREFTAMSNKTRNRATAWLKTEATARAARDGHFRWTAKIRNSGGRRIELNMKETSASLRESREVENGKAVWPQEMTEDLKKRNQIKYH
jgi:hypothetical protein